MRLACRVADNKRIHMIDSDILEKIKNGELVEIRITQTPDTPTPRFETDVRDMGTWLRQFSKSCGPHRCIYFSEKSNLKGDVTAEVTIGIIPNIQRNILIKKLQILAHESFKISFST